MKEMSETTGRLPEEYVQSMRKMLGEEAPAFFASYEERPGHGLRVNPNKIAPEALREAVPFGLRPLPWLRGGCFEITDADAAPGRHPFYFAGLYYLQEPSAMTPAQVLDVRPGESVLDLCAAPGGKSTALGAALRGEGLLLSNDISASRCRALLKNIEVFGIPNAVITNEVPARLAERFPGFFDKVLVDAPCSGEGMFRKDEAVIRAWDPEKPARCARIQKDIVVRGAGMLRPGGRLLYSTCTFAPEENEAVIAHLLRERPDMRLLPIPFREGFAGGIAGEGAGGLTPEEAACCVRIWPHRMRGEGHFMALLVREGGPADMSGGPAAQRDPAPASRRTSHGPGSPAPGSRRFSGAPRKGGRRDEGDPRSSFEAFREETRILIPGYGRERLSLRRELLFLPAVPESTLSGISCVRNGLLLGGCRKDRFEPGQALAMALTGIDPACRFDLEPETEEVVRYLKGESLHPSDTGRAGGKSGWRLVTVSGHALGWARLTGGILKNKYLAGWRMQ